MPRSLLGELVPVGGGDPIPLVNEVVTIGRRESCDICLKFQNISGTHCELSFVDGYWQVRDMGSTNGVKVNGERTTKKALRPDDEVSVATHRYKIRYELAPGARLDEALAQQEDIFNQSLMEKAGLEKPKGDRSGRNPGRAGNRRKTQSTDAPTGVDMAGPLTGKVAFVTGASSGIGRAAAVALAAAGADVALNYYSLPDYAEQTADEIRRLGRTALLFPADVSVQANVESMVAETVARLGRVDVFVSSAVYSDREPFTTADMVGFRKTIDVSMWGAYYGLRATCARMIERGEGGSAVIVSSPHAQIAFPNCMAYNMAKAALDQMMRTAAVELLPHKIRVNAVYPGWTDTPGERKFLADEAIKQAAQGLPWGRLATPEEIARAILFLADPAADYITGTVLHVDGGLFLPWWSKRGSGDL